MPRPIARLQIGFLLALAACGGHDESTAATSWAIVGGESDGEDPAVVAITYGPLLKCSGALIARDWVLTAGHCVGGEATDAPSLGHFVVFGSRIDEAGKPRKIRVAQQIAHPKAMGEGQGYDVALFKLETAVDDIAPMPLEARPWGPEALGTTIRHVGFGVSDEEQNSGGGIKRQVSYSVTRVEPLLLWSGAPGRQTCSFDSGGPALVRRDGTERILAVVSDGPNCHEDGADARVDVADVHDWISRETTPAADDGGCSFGRRTPRRSDDLVAALSWVVLGALFGMRLARRLRSSLRGR